MLEKTKLYELIIRAMLDYMNVSYLYQFESTKVSDPLKKTEIQKENFH